MDTSLSLCRRCWPVPCTNTESTVKVRIPIRARVFSPKVRTGRPCWSSVMRIVGTMRDGKACSCAARSFTNYTSGPSLRRGRSMLRSTNWSICSSWASRLSRFCRSQSVQASAIGVTTAFNYLRHTMSMETTRASSGWSMPLTSTASRWSSTSFTTTWGPTAIT